MTRWISQTRIVSNSSLAHDQSQVIDVVSGYSSFGVKKQLHWKFDRKKIAFEQTRNRQMKMFGWWHLKVKSVENYFRGSSQNIILSWLFSRSLSWYRETMKVFLAWFISSAVQLALKNRCQSPLSADMKSIKKKAKDPRNLFRQLIECRPWSVILLIVN